MASGHSWAVVIHFLFHLFVFIPTLKIFNFCRLLSEWVFGGGDQTFSPGLVDVRHILWRHHLSWAKGESLDNVLYIVARMEDAREFAWEDPDVHLLHLSRNGATFVRTEKGIDIYSSKVHPFCFLSKFYYAVEFGVISLEEFVQMPIEDDFRKSSPNIDPKDPNSTLANSPRSPTQASSRLYDKTVIFIVSLPRSGSTWILQHFENLPNCLAICEPPAFLNLAEMRALGVVVSPELLKRVVLFTCKSFFRRPGIEVIAVKILPWMMNDIIYLGNDLPFETRFIFTIRHPIPLMSSWLRILSEAASNAQGFAHQLPLIGPRFFPDEMGYKLDVSLVELATAELKSVVGNNKDWLRLFENLESAKKGMEEDDKILLTRKNGQLLSVGLTPLISNFFVFYVVGVLCFREMRRRRLDSGVDAMMIRYEDFAADPAASTTRMLRFCGIEVVSPEAEEAASPSRAQDSQSGSYYSRSQLEKHATSVTSDDVRQMESFLKEMGIAESLDELDGMI